MSPPDHLQQLNPEQYRAVTTLEGPLLILAGAGSGKTRVLTRRVAHLLHEGVEAEHVLAVTFTNKAAAEMKERVIELVGDVGAKVWISTFHSSCARILREDIEHLGWTDRFAIYDDEDQRRMLKDLLDRMGIDREKFTPRRLMSFIDHNKNRMRGPDEVIDEVRSHDRDIMIRVWRRYEKALRAADAVDFNDLIGHVVRLFESHPDVLAKWRDRFHYLLVDEYQDTNHGQYKLLRLLADGHRNLAVVGDDDQSIYGFRGADISNILGFEKDFPDAAVIRLEQNYRSTGNILEVANSVIAKNTKRKEKALWTEAGEGRKVRLVRRSSAQDEAAWVARSVRGLRERHDHAWGDMAVVYRTNATSRRFEREFAKLKIPHRIVGGRKFYERREVRDILGFLRLLINPADDAAFLRIVNVPSRGIGAKTLEKLREEASEKGEPLLDTARTSAVLSGRTGKAVKAFVALVDELTEISRTHEPAELVVETIQRTGYRSMLEGEDTKEAEGRLENLQALVRDAMEFEFPPDATSPADHLRAWLDRIALAGQDEEIPEAGEVTLLTVHNAKGLEYPVVFAVHMMEEQFPHARSMEEPGGVEEERRLAYVAFTRAQRLLVITWNREGAGWGRSSGGRADPSRFICDLPEDAVEGDDPIPDPATQTTPHEMRQVLDRKLDAFLQGHGVARTAEPAPEPSSIEGSHRLTEIHDVAQLQKGRRIHHPRLGIGTIRSLQRDVLWVDFGTGRPTSVRLRGVELHLVDD